MSNSYKDLLDVIDSRISQNSLTVCGKVTGLESGTNRAYVKIVGGDTIFKIQNKCGESLSIGDVVLIYKVNGNFSNSFIFVKFGDGAGGGGSEYVLPVATSSVLGGVKSGNGISVDEYGNVSLIPAITISTSTPTSSDGANGDIWIVYSS